MKPLSLVILSLALVGCGANGAPLRPTTSANVSVGTGGVSVGTDVGLTNGTFSVGLGQTFSRN